MIDEKRKRAYRYLLYRAMLDIRPLQLHGKIETFSPEDQRRNQKWAIGCGALAYWLHNLALTSVDDFKEFEETAFWEQYAYFKGKFPDFGFERYKKVFDEQCGPA